MMKLEGLLAVIDEMTVEDEAEAVALVTSSS